MLKHNLLIILRSFKRYKGIFLINLIGLSTGLACSLLIYLWVNDELNVDKFNSNDSRLYQVMENTRRSDGIATGEETPDLLARYLAEENPDVKYSTTVAPSSWFGEIPLSIPGKNLKAAGQFAGKDFFNVFSYHLIRGQRDKVLRNKNSVVISKQLAIKLFGTTGDVIGKTISWELLQYKFQSEISGLMEDVPNNSTQQFDFVLSFGSWVALCDSIHRAMNWDNHGPRTYVVLKNSANPALFNNKIKNFIKSKYSNSNVDLFIRPYSAGYLYNKYDNGNQAGGRIEYVRLFSIIALIILLIACINFMNLSTAKASWRSKEIGIKKVVGASRKALIIQYLGESMLLSVMSMILALMLVEIMLPQFNEITGKHIALALNSYLFIYLIIITLFTGFMAGSYPAFFLSGFSPSIILKGKLFKNGAELLARKGLVIFQFSLSVVFIAAVLVVYKQMEFIHLKNIGFNKDNIVYFDKAGNIASNENTFESELKSIPGVISVSSISQNIIGLNSSTIGLTWNGKNPSDIVQFMDVSVNYGMIETLGIKMIEGRTFSNNYGTDSSAIIFNETAIKTMGLKNPVGRNINLWGNNMHIIGVARDFNFESLHENVKPLFFILQPRRTFLIMAKIKGGLSKQTIDDIRSVYNKYNPGYVFDYKYLDDNYQELYLAEERTEVLSKYFAGIAIIISCLGLLGLTSYSAERRRKEIGIRKVLGASEIGIIYMLSSDFTKLVLVSIAIALPVSYFITRNWLDTFAYKITLSPWYFVSAGIAALLITWFTVGIQAVKAAAENPVASIKNE